MIQGKVSHGSEAKELERQWREGKFDIHDLSKTNAREVGSRARRQFLDLQIDVDSTCIVIAKSRLLNLSERWTCIASLHCRCNDYLMTLHEVT